MTCTNAAHYDAQDGAVAVKDELTLDPRLHVGDGTACKPTFGEATEFRLTRLELVRRLINVTRSLVLLEAERKELADHLGIEL